MLCSSPISVRTGGRHESMLVGCGQCLACRVNRRRIWTHRIMLEAGLYEDNSFITLTYAPENLTFVEGVDGVKRPTLVPAELRNFLKRFRKALEPRRIRFFGAGEYGEQSELPHYHLAVFGFPNCPWYGSHRSDSARDRCPVCGPVHRAWGLGLVDVGDLTDASAAYVAGYILKKMTGRDDLRLLGRHPEFSRMSNRPGIGADMMHEVASTLMSYKLDETQADVPSALRHGPRVMALGRYLHRKLRTYVGKSPDSPEAVQAEQKAEMQRLRDAQTSVPGRKSLRDVYLEENRGKLNNLEGKQRIRKQRKSL